MLYMIGWALWLLGASNVKIVLITVKSFLAFTNIFLAKIAGGGLQRGVDGLWCVLGLLVGMHA